ncbi:MAG: Mut7-C RNAse domain-containing protein [Dehalococcoidia bacterium]
MPTSAMPRFVVDANVGRLAKWLRALGYDTIFDKDIDDDTLIRIGLSQGRVLLTRDTRILERRVVTTGQLTAILVQDDDVFGQLKQVVGTLNLDSRNQRFSLCLVCNEPLIPVPKEEVHGEVPPYVFKTQSTFCRCPSCRKVYWQGTHWERMKAQLEKVQGEGVVSG